MIKKILPLIWLVLISACSSTPSYKHQEYAKLNHTKEFEEDFDIIWKGILESCADFKVEKVEKDNGLMFTDWVYATSNEKYVEYTVNGLPRKHFLQARYKYKITAEKFVGKVKVTVLQYEQLEKNKK